MSISSHSVINGLLSNKKEDVLEITNLLLIYDENEIPNQLLTYLNVSPLCIELLQTWSKYIIESTTIKKKKLENQISKNNETTERLIVINVLDCISTLLEYQTYIFDINLKNEIKDKIDKLAMLIITKYITNIYRHLNSNSKNLISSTLRLLASISNLSKNHKNEVLHTFNFNLPSFLTISNNFEYIKVKQSMENLYYFNDNLENIFILLNNRRKESNVRIQYLRFVLSFLHVNYEEEKEQEIIREFLKIKNLGNIIFKNSINYDDQIIIASLLVIFEINVIDNNYITNSNKKIFFNLNVINYIFGNLTNILSNIDLKSHLELNCSNNNLKRFLTIIKKLIKIHVNTKTKDKIILNWIKTIKQIKYPIIQDIIIDLYNELSFKEKMEYYNNVNTQVNIINNKLESVLLIGFSSKLLRNITHNEINELKEFIIENILKKQSITEIEENIKYLCNWIYPIYLNKLFNNIKILSINENLFINISIIIMLTNITKRLFNVIDIISKINIQSNIYTNEFIINIIKQNIYNSYPDMNNIINLLRNYFCDDLNENDVIKNSFLKQELLLNQINTNQKSELINDQDDDLFINISNEDIKKDLIHSNINNNPVFDTKYNILLYHYIINNINSCIMECVHCQNKNYFLNENIIRIKYEILKLIFNIIKFILKIFGNEFLLSMGYKFDYTKLLLDEIYRECYINKKFLCELKSDDYKVLFDKLLYNIIIYSLNINYDNYNFNCNKYLLFKFLDGIIVIIYNYQIKFDSSDNSNNINNNLKFLINYLTCMWINITCKLNNNRYKIFDYFGISSLPILEKNEYKKEYILNNNSFNNKYDEIKYYQYLDFKLILFIYKNIFNYSMLIYGFFEDYIKKEKIKKSFLKENMDLIILLLLINNKEKDEDNRYNLLINTMNFRNVVNNFKNEIDYVNKDILINVNEYIVKILKQRIEKEFCINDEFGSYFKLLLKKIFNNWNQYEYIRKDILKNNVNKVDLFNYNNLLLNIKYYYNILFESGYNIEFNIDEILINYIIIISINKTNDELDKDLISKIFKNILELNNFQLKSNKIVELIKINNLIKNEKSDLIIKLLINQFRIISKNDDIYKLIRSYIDIFMKLDINNELLFNILLDNVINNNINLYKELMNEIIYNRNFKGKEEFLNVFIIDIILNNVSKEEIVLLCNHILENNELDKLNKLFLSKLIQKTFELYLNLKNYDSKLFEVYFLNFINIIINKNIFDYFNIKLYRLNYKDNKINDDKVYLYLPLDLFGNIKDNNTNNKIFLFLLIKLLPNLYLNYIEFYEELITIINEYLFEDIPIGIKLLLIYDNNLYLSYINNSIKLNQEEIVNVSVNDLIYNLNNYLDKKDKINKIDINEDKFKILDLLDFNTKDISKLYLKNYQDILKHQDLNFWSIMNLFIFKYNIKKNIDFKRIIINSNLIFRFVIELFLKYNERSQYHNNNDILEICEITYLVYLFHYESFSLNYYDDNLIINTFIFCYDKLLNKFQDLIKNEDKELNLYYYYLILTPIAMDRCINPIYYYLIKEIKNSYNNSQELSIYYNILIKLKKNYSFYEFLNLIKLKEEYKLKYPIAFIETSKIFINYSKTILDKQTNNISNNIFNILLIFTLYMAEFKQLKIKYVDNIYNNLPNFVLLKINRINVFLTKLHELFFNYLNLEYETIDYECSGTTLILFLFVEYLLILKETEFNNFDDNNGYITVKDIKNYMNVTKINNFINKNSLYNNLLEYSHKNYKGITINTNNWIKIMLSSYNIYKTNSKINELLNLNIINDEIDQFKLTKYWYHYYSIYILNFIDIDNIEFNWINPNIKRLNKILNNFPYDSKLSGNNLFIFNINKNDFKTDKKEYIYSYDLDYILPIINSRFKLAYSILRERGFHNSKNKINLIENEKNDLEIGSMNDLNSNKKIDNRNCSGFIEDYITLSNSKFFQMIDNDFIWLRDFCKNGSLQILINSLSCIDISIRFYSYQCLSLLYEIINFHYTKYIKKIDEIEKQKLIQNDDDNNSSENEDISEKMNKKRKRSKKKFNNYVRHIFKELPQVYAILKTIKNTVSGAIYSDDNNCNIHLDCIRLSSFVTKFLSDSINIIFEPEHKLYKQINYFILSRSYIDRYDVPLLFTLLYSEDTSDHSIYKSFIFKELIHNMKIFNLIKIKDNELEQEHDALNRRFIFPLLLNYIKTNNIYSYHDFFINVINILTIILNMVNNNETNVTHYINNLENYNQIYYSVPNIPLKNNLKIENKTKSNSLLSSITLTTQLLNQYSLLDFIENLIRQLSNNKDDVNINYIKTIFNIITKILINITQNIFININDIILNNENFDYFQLYILKYENNQINKIILKSLGGYSNSYSIFQKLLNCIKLLSAYILNNNNNNNNNNIQNNNNNININNNNDFQYQQFIKQIYDIWFNSYTGLLYVFKYILHGIETVDSYNQLIYNYQLFYHYFYKSQIN